MSSDALFGLSILMSLIAFAIVTKVLILPRLRGMPRRDALIPLVIPHTFRFLGLSFLVPGVVSPFDLLHAIYAGQISVGIDPGSLGAAFFIPTVVVPLLLVTHGLMFWVLLRPKQ